MKDVLISSMMSMSDDSFASESLTTECVLSSNEISYSLKSLIDIEAADYSFIDEVIAQIVYDQLQIESLTLIKVNSIREFDDYYAKKLIIHVIYSNLTVQDHTINTVFMLITRLNQHQMILEKTWMNKINLVIDMQINSLRFSNFISSQKLIVLLSSHRIITKQKSLTSTHILRRLFTFVISQLSQKSLSFNQSKEKFVKSIKQSKSLEAVSSSVNFKSTFSLKPAFSSINIFMIEAAAYRMLVKWSDIKIFAVIILKNDWLITTVKNKSEEVNLHELLHVETLKQVKIKLFSKYHDYLDIFDQAMIDQLLSHHIYNHKIELIDKNCTLLREAIARDETQYKDIKLKNCWNQNKILYHDSQLWVSFNELLQMNLIREIHDQSSINHSEILKTMKIIKRNYYWSSM